MCPAHSHILENQSYKSTDVEDKKDFVNDKKDCNCVNAFNKNSPNTLKAKRKQSPKASACRTLLKAELHISVNDAGEK